MEMEVTIYKVSKRKKVPDSILGIISFKNGKVTADKQVAHFLSGDEGKSQIERLGNWSNGYYYGKITSSKKSLSDSIKERVQELTNED